MATTGVGPQIGSQAGYNRATDCDPCWIRRKKPIPAVGKWGRVPYCEDCKRENDIDDDDEDWVVFSVAAGVRDSANQRPAPVLTKEVVRKAHDTIKAALTAPPDDPRFSAAGMAMAPPEKVSSRTMRQPLPEQIPAFSKPVGICTRTERCHKPFGHTGRCPKNLPKPAKQPKETWQVPGSSTETPKVVKETKLAAAARLGSEIRDGLGGKARHARGEEQTTAAWELQFRELSDEEYAGIVPQRFLQKELEPIVQAIAAKHAEQTKKGQPPKVRIVIDVPHHTLARHFRDRVSRYMKLRRVACHTEQVARTKQVIVTAPAEKAPWGKRANGKQPT